MALVPALLWTTFLKNNNKLFSAKQSRNHASNQPKSQLSTRFSFAYTRRFPSTTTTTTPSTNTSKMTYWRQAGLSYLRYSRIAAQQVRKSLKADSKVDPIKDTSTIKVSFKAKEVAAAK